VGAERDGDRAGGGPRMAICAHGCLMWQFYHILLWEASTFVKCLHTCEFSFYHPASAVSSPFIFFSIYPSLSCLRPTHWHPTTFLCRRHYSLSGPILVSHRRLSPLLLCSHLGGLVIRSVMELLPSHRRSCVNFLGRMPRGFSLGGHLTPRLPSCFLPRARRFRWGSPCSAGGRLVFSISGGDLYYLVDFVYFGV
jgi:hypothetical protein